MEETATIPMDEYKRLKALEDGIINGNGAVVRTEFGLGSSLRETLYFYDKDEAFDMLNNQIKALTTSVYEANNINRKLLRVNSEIKQMSIFQFIKWRRE